jgi:hypothetical protein
MGKNSTPHAWGSPANNSLTQSLLVMVICGASPVPEGEMMHQRGLQWPIDANKGGIIDAGAMLSRSDLNECSMLNAGVCGWWRCAATALAAGICWKDDWLASPSNGSA